MQLPPILQGESLTRLLQGAFVGFLATVVIGFGWGGWTLGSTARETVEKCSRRRRGGSGPGVCRQVPPGRR